MAASVKDLSWVEWMTMLMGGVSRQAHAATFPPDRFYCLLDELPLHLIPQHARRLLRAEDSVLVYLNPTCVFSWGEEIPEELLQHKELLSGFALPGDIAWVRERPGAVQPFWLGPEFEGLLRRVRPHEPLDPSFPLGARRILQTAGILVPDRHEFERDRKREAMLAAAAQLFREQGYAPLPELIHPFHVAALRRYYRHQIRCGAIQLGDRQSPFRYAVHNEPVARFFHHQIAAALSAVAGEPIKPSYVYFASYLSGAELKRHTDREQCDFSITLCLDFSPEPELATPWPILLDTPTGTVTVYQALGDGLAYRGTRLPHYRRPLPQGQTSTSIFFHYVGEDFRGTLD